MTDTHNQPNDSELHTILSNYGVYLPRPGDKPKGMTSFRESLEGELNALIAQARIQGAEELAERMRDMMSPDEMRVLTLNSFHLDTAIAAYKSEQSKDGK